MTDMTDVIRGEFEAWAIPQGFRIHVREVKGAIRFGQYCDDTTQAAWDAYQAALQSPAVRELVDASRAFAPASPTSKREIALCKAIANFASIKGDKA